MASLRAACALFLGVSFPLVGAAQLGADGTPITTSDYTIDLTRGVVISTSRVVGLSGAATSLAQGVEGGLQNPAAVAYRGPQWPDWYDYWLALGVTYPFQAGDFYNSGDFVRNTRSIDDDATLFLIPGAYWQMWNFGIGLTIDSQFVKLQLAAGAPGGDGDTLRLRFTTFHIQAGYGFLDGQLILGGGLRILRERAYLSDRIVSPGDAYRTLGLGAEIGLMIKPHNKRWNLGASVFPKISTGLRTRGSVIETPDGELTIDGFFLPRKTEIPTSGSVGFSYQFGPRPTNPPWISAEQLASDELERLNRRKDRLKREEKEELASAPVRCGSQADICKRAIRQRYARKHAALKAARKEMKKLAWEQLRKEYRWDWPRRYYLLTVDLWFNGRVDGGVGVESFLAQIVQRSGQQITVSPHIGFESEVWPTRMKIRVGTYLEPSRFSQSSARMHGTFGFDVSLFRWSVFGLWPRDYRWQVTTAFDFARDYGSFSVGIGGWY
jgi:hypothetical protein